jgi:hypothetical protein
LVLVSPFEFASVVPSSLFPTIEASEASGSPASSTTATSALPLSGTTLAENDAPQETGSKTRPRATRASRKNNAHPEK